MSVSPWIVLRTHHFVSMPEDESLFSQLQLLLSVSMSPLGSLIHRSLTFMTNHRPTVTTTVHISLLHPTTILTGPATPFGRLDLLSPVSARERVFAHDLDLDHTYPFPQSGSGSFDAKCGSPTYERSSPGPDSLVENRSSAHLHLPTHSSSRTFVRTWNMARPHRPSNPFSQWRSTH
jgi:hypothetical protein